MFAAVNEDVCRTLLYLFVLVLRRSSTTLAPHVTRAERAHYNSLRACLSSEVAHVMRAAPEPHTIPRTQMLARAALSVHTLRVYSRLLADMEAALRRRHAPETEVAAQELLSEVETLLWAYQAAVRKDTELRGREREERKRREEEEAARKEGPKGKGEKEGGDAGKAPKDGDGAVDGASGDAAHPPPNEFYTLPEMVLMECNVSGWVGTGGGREGAGGCNAANSSGRCLGPLFSMCLKHLHRYAWVSRRPPQAWCVLPAALHGTHPTPHCALSASTP